MNNLNARLRKLESVQADGDTAPIMLLPSDGTENEAEVRAAWDRFVDTGLADSPVIVIPLDAPEHSAGRQGISTIARVVEDPHFYRNTAHALESPNDPDPMKPSSAEWYGYGPDGTHVMSGSLDYLAPNPASVTLQSAMPPAEPG